MTSTYKQHTSYRREGGPLIDKPSRKTGIKNQHLCPLVQQYKYITLENMYAFAFRLDTPWQ